MLEISLGLDLDQKQIGSEIVSLSSLDKLDYVDTKVLLKIYKFRKQIYYSTFIGSLPNR